MQLEAPEIPSIWQDPHAYDADIIYAKGDEIKGMKLKSWSFCTWGDTFLHNAPPTLALFVSPQCHFLEYCKLQSRLYSKDVYKSGREINPRRTLRYFFRWRERKDVGLLRREWEKCDSAARSMKSSLKIDCVRSEFTTPITVRTDYWNVTPCSLFYKYLTVEEYLAIYIM